MARSDDTRIQKVVRRLLEATDGAINQLEELKAARAALSLEANRKPLKVVRAQDDREDDK